MPATVLHPQQDAKKTDNPKSLIVSLGRGKPRLHPPSPRIMSAFNNHRSPSLKREQSMELGDDSMIDSVNQKTGRPIRRTAGKISRHSSYVSTPQLDSDEDFVSSDDDTLIDAEPEPAFDPEELALFKPREKKRKRTPSPSPARLSPVPDLALKTPNSSRSSSPPAVFEGAGSTADPYDRVVNLTFNIEPGFSGPLHIKLDMGAFRPAKQSRPNKPVRQISQHSEQAMDVDPASTQATGFLSLPAELRNEVYRLALVTEAPIDLTKCTNNQRSAALLRTCKQVYEEARTVLYSENTFLTERNKTVSRNMFSPDQKEVGYKHLHHWLHNMKPSTRALLRDIRIDFDDALPSHTPKAKNSEERRYVHDGHLIASFKLLAQDAKLRKISLSFAGRRTLHKTEHRFMKYLGAVRADRIEIKPLNPKYCWGTWHRIAYDAEDQIKREMERKEKLYPVE